MKIRSRRRRNAASVGKDSILARIRAARAARAARVGNGKRRKSRKSARVRNAFGYALRRAGSPGFGRSRVKNRAARKANRTRRVLRRRNGVLGGLDYKSIAIKVAMLGVGVYVADRFSNFVETSILTMIPASAGQTVVGVGNLVVAGLVVALGDLADKKVGSKYHVDFVTAAIAANQVSRGLARLMPAESTEPLTTSGTFLSGSYLSGSHSAMVNRLQGQFQPSLQGSYAPPPGELSGTFTSPQTATTHSIMQGSSGGRRGSRAMC